MDGVVLVLDRNYPPLNVCNLPRAFRLLFGAKAEVVEYDHQTIRTPRAAYRAPSVIRLQHHVRRPRPRVLPARTLRWPASPAGSVWAMSLPTSSPAGSAGAAVASARARSSQFMMKATSAST